MQKNTIENKKIIISIILWMCAILIVPICDFIGQEMYKACSFITCRQLMVFIVKTFIRNLAYFTIGYIYYHTLHIKEKINLKLIWSRYIFIRLIGIQLIAFFIQILISGLDIELIIPFFKEYPIVRQVPCVMDRMVDFAILICIVRCIEIEFFNRDIKHNGYIWKDKKVIVIILLCIALQTLYNFLLYKNPLMGIGNAAQLLSLFKTIDLQSFRAQICESLVFMYAVYRRWKIHNI